MNRTAYFFAFCSIWTGSVFAAGDVAGHGDGKTEAGAVDPESAIKTFKADPGMKIELWASEPLLANPVSFSQDEKGRWYVAESYRQEGRNVNGKPTVGGVVDNRGHMIWLNADLAAQKVEDRLAMLHKYYPDPKKFAEAFETEQERIVMVEDTKGAGHADKSSVFAEGFRDALDGTGAGILARGKDVWWTCIPNLWHFQDTDADGKADTREKLLSGFGVKVAFRGHDMHGLRFGPDGKLYFSIGDRGLHVTDKEGHEVAVTDTGSIMRCNPDGTDFEIFATGVRNPQELAFDEFGNLFTGDNNSDAGDRARFVQLVEGGDCGWRMSFQYLDDRGPWNRELLWDEKEGPKAKYIIPPVANLSNGPSGLAYNPGTALSKEYAGKFFLCDFRGGASSSVIHEIAIEPSGAWFKLKQRRDFVKGVLTTDADFGADGSLYVLDWVESWSGVNKGRIYKFSAPGADKEKQAEVQKLISEGMGARPEAELSALLGHADQRVRQAAQFELAGRGAVAPLTEAAQKGASTLARIHGVWGLGQVASKQPAVLQTVAGLLADADGEVRAQSARVLGDHRYAEANAALTSALKDSYARTRFYAALALGKAGYKGAVDPLFSMLAQNADKDPILRHGAVMGLVACATPEELVAKETDLNPSVRVGAAIALRRLRSPLISTFLHDSDKSIVLEAARAIYDLPIEPAMPALADALTNFGNANEHMLLRAIHAHYRLGQEANAKALADFAATGNAPAASRSEALTVLAAWANPDPKDRLTSAWRPLPKRPSDAAIAALSPVVANIIKDSPGDVQESAAAAAGKLGLTSAAEALLALVEKDSAGKDARVAALQALGTLKDKNLGRAAKAALTDASLKLRAAGLKALVIADPAAAIKTIGEVLRSNASPTEKQGAVLALSDIKSPEADQLLIGLMDDLIAGRLAQEAQLEVYEAANRRPALAAKVEQWKASLPANDPLAKYRISLAGGDAARGKKTFREHPTAQCFKCHRAEGGDSLVGPDLTKVGGRKDRGYILESIVFPNKAIAEGFQIVILEMKDGSIIAGRLLSETPQELKVETVDNQGKPQAMPVKVASIKTRSSAPSPMPETLRDQLSPSELRDVVEYLSSLK